MAERVDLEQAQARFDRAAAHRFSGPSRYTNEHVADLASSAGDVPALVAELRAHRAVRDEISRLYEDDRIDLDDDEHERLLHLLTAVDQATDQPDPAAGHAEPEGPP